MFRLEDVDEPYRGVCMEGAAGQRRLHEERRRCRTRWLEFLLRGSFGVSSPHTEAKGLPMWMPVRYRSCTLRVHSAGSFDIVPSFSSFQSWVSATFTHRDMMKEVVRRLRTGSARVVHARASWPVLIHCATQRVEIQVTSFKASSTLRAQKQAGQPLHPRMQSPTSTLNNLCLICFPWFLFCFRSSCSGRPQIHQLCVRSLRSRAGGPLSGQVVPASLSWEQLFWGALVLYLAGPGTKLRSIWSLHRKVVWLGTCSDHMGGCQNCGPFLGLEYDTAPSI